MRGPFFRLLEDIPVVGYIVAGIDEIEGDYVSNVEKTPFLMIDF